MYIEFGTLWYLLFAGNLAGASPESRRKVAGESPERHRKIAKAKFLLETRSGEKYDVLAVSGMVSEACKALYL